MKLTNSQIEAMRSLYKMLDEERETADFSQVLIDMLLVLRELNVSLEDFEKIIGIEDI